MFRHSQYSHLLCQLLTTIMPVVLQVVWVEDMMVAGQLCGEDEFFDAVVDKCSLCSDVCDLCRAPESLSFCSRNCPEYYGKMQQERRNCATGFLNGRSLAPPMLTSSTMTSRQNDFGSSLTSNPLLWTTIVSLSVAVIATLVIVPLVICIQLRQQRRARGSDADSEKQALAPPSSGSSSSSSSTSSETEKPPQTPTTPPPDDVFSTEKTGVLPPLTAHNLCNV